MTTACCHLLIGAHVRHKPVFPLHRTDSRWITHSSAKTLEKGEKQINRSNRKGGDTEVPCPAFFQNHGVITTGGGGSYLVWNWSSLCEAFEYPLQGTGRGIIALIPKVREVSWWPQSGIKPRHALYIGLHLPLTKHLRNGCRLVSSRTFSQAQISSRPPQHGKLFELVTMFTAEFFFPCAQLQRGNQKEKHQKYQPGPGYTDRFVWCGFLSIWT